MKKILIIDDEEDFCFVLQRNLEAVGDFETEVCIDSTKAIDKVNSFRPDLIILDVMMPEVSGSDIASELKSREDTKNIPIVFLTAIITNDEAEKRSNIVGGQYFLAKPIEIEILVKAINKFLTEQNP